MSARVTGIPALLATLCLAAAAGAAIPGDVDQNCVVNAADALLLARGLMGEVTLGSQQQSAADVAPIVSGTSAPDGSSTIADLVVLLRAVAGLQQLPNGVNVPTLGSPSGPVLVSQITVTGEACPGDTVTLFVNGLSRRSMTASASDGTFAFSLIGISYDTNTLMARATASGLTSGDSNVLEVDNQSPSINTSPPPPVSGISVWPPPRGGGAYVITNDFTIPSGSTLILPPGTIVQFATGTLLTVNGRLWIQGAGGPEINRVRLQRQGTSGSWDGILVTSNQGTLIERAYIDDARVGVDIFGASASATVRACTITASIMRGIDIHGGASATVESVWVNGGSNVGINIDNAAGALLTGNAVNGKSTGVWINDSSPSGQPPTVVLRGNQLAGNTTGLRIDGNSSPHVIDGNRIFSNGSAGIFVRTGSVGEPPPNPVFNGNEIRDNPIGSVPKMNLWIDAGVNPVVPFSNARTTMIDATGNWWGSTDPVVIADGIEDYSESFGIPVNKLTPVVDFVPFSSSFGGPLAPSSTYLLGIVNGSLPPLAGGAAYQVVGSLIVPAGTAWTLAAGAKLDLLDDSQFDVFGSLAVAGSAAQPVTLRFAPGESGTTWPGIEISGSTASAVIEHAVIEKIRDSVAARSNASLTIRDSEILQYSVTAIVFASGTQGSVEDSLLENLVRSGTGISIDGASPTISGTTIHRSGSGIRVTGMSSPMIGPGNLIQDFNSVGIDIDAPATGTIIGNEIDGAPLGQNFGIDVSAASPLIQGNTIHDTETAIRISGNSGAVVNAGNVLFDNIWGIWLQGTGAASGNPHPTINRNSIHDNSGPSPNAPNTTYCSTQGANLCTSNFSVGSTLLVNARENWWGSDVAATIRASIRSDPNNPVPVDLSNFLASEGGEPNSTPLFSFVATGITHTPNLMAPTLGNTLSVQFTTVAPADVTLRIYEEDHDADQGNPALALRTISQSVGAGAQSIVWDGKNDAGQFLPDEAYAYVLATNVSGMIDTYNPPREGLAVGTSSPSDVPTSYNVHRNQPLKILFDLDQNRGRIKISRTPKNASGQPAGPFVTLVDDAPFPHLFNQLFVYDGFDPAGNFLEGLYSLGYVYFRWPIPLKRNAVIVERTRPVIAGPGYASVRTNPPVSGGKPPAPPAPLIEVKADPYLIRHSYDQLTRIAFCIDQAAFLTVKILKPGHGNPDVQADVVATLVNDTATPHAALDCIGGAPPYVVEWDGLEPGNPEPYVMRPDADGSYTFTIEARNALQPSLRSIYRGIVQARR